MTHLKAEYEWIRARRKATYLSGAAPICFHHLSPQCFTLEFIQYIFCIIKDVFQLPKPDSLLLIMSLLFLCIQQYGFDYGQVSSSFSKSSSTPHVNLTSWKKGELIITRNFTAMLKRNDSAIFFWRTNKKLMVCEMDTAVCERVRWRRTLWNGSPSTISLGGNDRHW